MNTDTCMYQFHYAPIKNQDSWMSAQQHQKFIVNAKVSFMMYKITDGKGKTEIPILPIAIQCLQKGNI